MIYIIKITSLIEVFATTKLWIGRGNAYCIDMESDERDGNGHEASIIENVGSSETLSNTVPNVKLENEWTFILGHDRLRKRVSVCPIIENNNINLYLYKQCK